MRQLRELQKGFSRDIFTGGTAFGAQIKANGLDSDRRLRIYRNNTYLNFTDALRVAYPVIERLVGEGFFNYAAHHYITHSPSTSGDLHEFGETFGDFLEGFETAAELGYLPDVARLEWAVDQVYYAPAHSPLSIAALAEIPEDRQGDLKFVLNPACRLLHSAYPALAIWQVNQAHFVGDPHVDLSRGGGGLLVIRNNGLDVEIHPLQEGEFVLLRQLAENSDFITACEHALSIQGDFDVASCFRHHIEQMTLVDFSP